MKRVKIVRLPSKNKKVVKTESGDPAMFFAAVATIVGIYFLVESINNAGPEGFLNLGYLTGAIVCMGLVAFSGGAATYFESGRKLSLPAILFAAAGTLSFLFPLTLLF